jgi:hypothetical protein
MNGKIILGNGLTSLPFDFSMFLCEAYCAAEMEDVPRDLFDLWRWVAVFASSTLCFKRSSHTSWFAQYLCLSRYLLLPNNPIL